MSLKSFLIGALIIFSFSILSAQGISFEKGSWAEIIKKAKAENKYIFVFPYAEWCSPCKWMTKNVFTDAKVAENFNSKFVNYKFDMEKGEGPKFAKAYAVTAYPTLLFINPNGELAHKVLGAISADQLLMQSIKMFPSVKDFNNTPAKRASSGTGFAINSNGTIITNHHVTEGATSIKVRGVNGDFSIAFSAKVIIEDSKNDLSIIKIDDPNFTDLGTIPYTISNRQADVGSSVFVLGYPLRASMGDEVKLTNGIISSRSGFKGDITSYQITAPIQPGNSGGPLFDDKGSLIGVINAKHVEAENVSYAIKVSYLMNLIETIPNSLKLQTISSVLDKPLTEQVKIIKNFTYIIEIIE
jgi:S1-C subfamily serine protease